MPVLWMIPVSVGRVSFDNLAALMQSETSPMSAFLAPVSLLLGVCHVTGAWEQTQTIGELSSGVRGVFTHYLYLLLHNFFPLGIIHLKSAKCHHNCRRKARVAESAEVRAGASQYQSCVSRGQMSRDIATIFIARRMVHCDLVRRVYWPMRLQ